MLVRMQFWGSWSRRKRTSCWGLVSPLLWFDIDPIVNVFSSLLGLVVSVKGVVEANCGHIFEGGVKESFADRKMSIWGPCFRIYFGNSVPSQCTMGSSLLLWNYCTDYRSASSVIKYFFFFFRFFSWDGVSATASNTLSTMAVAESEGFPESGFLIVELGSGSKSMASTSCEFSFACWLALLSFLAFFLALLSSCESGSSGTMRNVGGEPDET